MFIEEGIVHCCVGKMSGAAPCTSMVALTNATIRYGLKIASIGLENTVKASTTIAKNVNYYDGKCTNANVAKTLGT